MAFGNRKQADLVRSGYEGHELGSVPLGHPRKIELDQDRPHRPNAETDRSNDVVDGDGARAKHAENEIALLRYGFRWR